MGLAVEDLQQIEQLIAQRLQPLAGPREVVYSGQLLERIVRGEEGLLHQRELIQTMQQQMEKRFEQVDKRFEQVDKRFEMMQQMMEKRFEQVDKRFEQMDKRFEQMQQQMDKRFEQLSGRMDRMMLWSFSLMLLIAGSSLALLRYWMVTGS